MKSYKNDRSFFLYVYSIHLYYIVILRYFEKTVYIMYIVLLNSLEFTLDSNLCNSVSLLLGMFNVLGFSFVLFLFPHVDVSTIM